MEHFSGRQYSAPGAITKWIFKWLAMWDESAKHQYNLMERIDKIAELKLLQKLPAPLPCLLGKHNRFKVPDNLRNSYCMGCGHHLVPKPGSHFYDANGEFIDSEWITDKEYALLPRRE